MRLPMRKYNIIIWTVYYVVIYIGTIIHLGYCKVLFFLHMTFSDACKVIHKSVHEEREGQQHKLPILTGLNQHLIPCSFQTGPHWTKPKVDSPGWLIWWLRLCAIDHFLRSVADLESSSKGWVYSALIFHFRGAQYMQAYVTSNVPTWKRLLCA